MQTYSPLPQPSPLHKQLFRKTRRNRKTNKYPYASPDPTRTGSALLVVVAVYVSVVDMVLLIPLVSILSHFKIIYHKLSQQPAREREREREKGREGGQPSRLFSLCSIPIHPSRSVSYRCLSIPFRYISVIAMTAGHINFSAQTLENLFKQQISRCE